MTRAEKILLGVIAAALAACLVLFRLHFVMLGDQIRPQNTDELHSVDFERVRMSEVNRCRSLTYLGATNVSDESLSQLDTMPKLECFFVTFSDLGTGSMQKLSEFPALHDILFMNCRVNVTGLNPPALNRLQIMGGELYNAEALGECQPLRLFSIDSAIVDGAVTKENDVYTLQDAGFLAALDQVTELGIYGYEIGDISKILEMDSLETLYINHSTLSDDDRKALESRGITVTVHQEEEHAGETN